MNTACEQITFISEEQKQDTRRNTLRLRERLMTEHGFEKKTIPLLKYYSVFHISQCPGMKPRFASSVSEHSDLQPDKRAEQISTMQDMLTPEGALAALRADHTNIHSSGFQKALNLLPELLGDAFTQEQLAMLYDNKFRTACGGKLESTGKYRYIVPDVIALFEACLLGIQPKGVIKAGEVWQHSLTPGHKVDVLRSPHMYTTEHCIRTVAQYRKAFMFMDTDAVYLSIWGTDARQMMCDYDGDIALVVDDELDEPIGLSTIYKLVKQKDFPSVKIGGRFFVIENKVEAWLQSLSAKRKQ